MAGVRFMALSASTRGMAVASSKGSSGERSEKKKKTYSQDAVALVCYNMIVIASEFRGRPGGFYTQSYLRYIP